MSTHINAAKNAIAPSVLMPGDPLRVKHIAENYLQDAVCYNEVRGMYGFTGTYKGVPVSVQGSGMGMPSMGIYSWELITEYDVENLIRIGTAGSFHESVKMGDVVMGIAASTDSNYIHAFDAPAGYSPSADFGLIKKALAANEELGINVTAGNIVSCDVFYETDPKWWHAWAKMGVLAVEIRRVKKTCYRLEEHMVHKTPRNTFGYCSYCYSHNKCARGQTVSIFSFDTQSLQRSFPAK